VDCGVRVYVQNAYDALTRPPSPLPAIITALLTLYTALLGWGLLSGRGPRLADTPQIALRIGVILALTLSWPLFQTLVFDTAFRGADAFASALAGAARGQAGDLGPVLQTAYDEIVLTAGALGAEAGGDTGALRGGPGAAAEMLWSASAALIASTLGVTLVAKVVVGVLTAIGPVFIALFLLEATRGLFVGWLRALMTAALVPLVSSGGTALLLALLQPRLVNLAALREAGLADLSIATSVAALIFVFAAVQIGLVLAMAVIGLSFQLKAPEPPREPVNPPAPPSAAAATSLETSAHAAAVAQSARRLQIRDHRTEVETQRSSEGLNAASVQTRNEADGPARLGRINRRLRAPASSSERTA
jgi:type IV secretion system protein VirB6